jgi:hypothetical protein
MERPSGRRHARRRRHAVERRVLRRRFVHVRVVYFRRRRRRRGRVRRGGGVRVLESGAAKTKTRALRGVASQARPSHAGPRATASARRAPFLEAFARARISPPRVPRRFQSRHPSVPHDSATDASLNATPTRFASRGPSTLSNVDVIDMTSGENRRSIVSGFLSMLLAPRPTETRGVGTAASVPTRGWSDNDVWTAGREGSPDPDRIARALAGTPPETRNGWSRVRAMLRSSSSSSGRKYKV